MTINKTEVYGLAALCGIIAGRVAASWAGLPQTGFGTIGYNSLGAAAALCSVAQAVSTAMMTATLILVSRTGSLVSRTGSLVPRTGSAEVLCRTRLDRQSAVLPMVILTVFSSSFFCYISDSLSQIVSPPWIESLATNDFVKRQLESLCGIIDNIGFTDKENNALVKALISGDRQSLSPKTIAAFRDSGASHILALSGLHFGVVYMIISALLKVLGNSPAAGRARAVLTIAATACYAILTGAGPSVCRAFIFIVLREISKTAHRDSSLRTVLWSSFICQTALQPTAIGSVSFQLSYTAIVGIAYINPLLSRTYDMFVSLFQHDYNAENEDRTINSTGTSPQRSTGKSPHSSTETSSHRSNETSPHNDVAGNNIFGLRRNNSLMRLRRNNSLMRRLWQSLSVSLSCQIATAPLAWYHFQSFPQYFLIANLFALPAIGVVIPLSVACIFMTATGLPPSLIIRIDEWLLNYVRWVLDTVANIPPAM